jgi:hypothetical protein
LNPGKNEPIEQNREALSARQVSDNLVRLPGLCEDWCLLGMLAAIYVPHAVSPGGGSRKQQSTRHNKQSISQHRPLPGSGTRRAPDTFIKPRAMSVKWPEGQELLMRHWTNGR